MRTLSRYLCPIQLSIVHIFLLIVFHLYGRLESIVIDRDVISTSYFSQELFRLWNEIDLLLCISPIVRRTDRYKGEWEILVLWQCFQKLTLLGNHCLNLLPLILLLSLRTSSLSRREEMLWMHIQDMCIRRGIGLMSTTNN